MTIAIATVKRPRRFGTRKMGVIDANVAVCGLQHVTSSDDISLELLMPIARRPEGNITTFLYNTILLLERRGIYRFKYSIRLTYQF